MYDNNKYYHYIVCLETLEVPLKDIPSRVKELIKESGGKPDSDKSKLRKVIVFLFEFVCGWVA